MIDIWLKAEIAFITIDKLEIYLRIIKGMRMS